MGNYMCEELVNRGHAVRAMTHYNTHNLDRLRDRVEIVKADIRFQDECVEAAEDCDCVIHLAACIHVDRSRRYPRLFWETNVGGTMNMLEAARRRDCRMVHMSTCEVLGNIPVGKADETYPFKQPRSPYAASKYAAEAYCHSYHATYGLPVNIARGFNLCGPRQKRGGKGALIPIFVDLALRGKPLTIYGDGLQTRDYTDVRDVVKGLRLLAESTYRGELFHLCSGVETTVNKIAELVLELTGSNVKPIHGPPRPGELRRSVGDNAKAWKMLGWNPEIPLRQTVQDVVNGLAGRVHPHRATAEG